MSSALPSPPQASTSSRPAKTRLCPHCAKRFSTAGHLSRHVRIHSSSGRTFVCAFPGCATACSRRDNLRQHYRLHFDVRDPEELHGRAPHKKWRKPRVQRVDTRFPGGDHVMSGSVPLPTYSAQPPSSHARPPADVSISVASTTGTLISPLLNADLFEDGADVLIRLHAEARSRTAASDL
ncbi:hypothetical protein MIND_00643200 [Mycena indigotica]|uniref:C2H2-type domain-containing protein n=1 Tax=Mycena indigotica TaxID=2126181 RepID=A0A8H6SRE5_9AGAR|nr:uncharacterized protein MIND_00643200 [Mycena indigotica]KAF7304116.1 hypothetical protein MIND_00643200 [Mycena indigotica]